MTTLQSSLSFTSFPGSYRSVFIKIVLKLSLDCSLITQLLKRFVPIDNCHDIGCLEVEGRNVNISFLRFSIEMTMQYVDCLYICHGE